MSIYKYEVELDRVSDWCEFESDKELTEFEIQQRAIEEICYYIKLYNYKVEKVK